MVLGAHMALWGTFSSALNKFTLQEVNLKIGHILSVEQKLIKFLSVCLDLI